LSKKAGPLSPEPPREDIDVPNIEDDPIDLLYTESADKVEEQFKFAEFDNTDFLDVSDDNDNPFREPKISNTFDLEETYDDAIALQITTRGAEVVIATEKLIKRIQAKIAKAEKKAKQYKEEVGKLVKDRNSKKKETRPKAERKLENAKKRKEALEAIDPEDRILAENNTNDDTIIETVLDKTRDM
ncbi:hypothetical protein EG328_005772, partial [Venturia inaequalis]